MQPTPASPPIPEPATVGWALNFCLASYVDYPNQYVKPAPPKPQLNIEFAVSQIEGAQGYTVVWSSDQTAMDNYAYIVQSPGNDPAYYLVMRGSLVPAFLGTDAHGTALQLFYNWVVEDLDVFSQVKWKFAPKADAWIAQGAYTAFKNILGAYNKLPKSGQQTAWEYLKENAFQNNRPVYVTGHSLGGNIAYTYGSYLAQQAHDAGYSTDALYLYTFAGPAPGNQDFVNDLASKYPERALHFEVEYDVVPKFPNKEAMINQMAGFYAPTPLASKVELFHNMFTLQELLTTVANGIYGAVTADGPGRAYALSQAVVLPSNLTKNEPNTLFAWLYEAYTQHSLTAYSAGITVESAPAVTPKTLNALLPYITQARANVLVSPGVAGAALAGGALAQ